MRPQGNPGTGARSVRLVAPGWTAGETNELVVEIDALGDEHLLSFSVEFDPGLLRYLGVVPGQSVPGGSLLVNPASAAAGRLGAGLLLPPELNLDPGTLELLRLRFAVPGLAEGRTTQIDFGDRPTVRDTTGIDGLPLATDYVGLTLTVGAPPTLRLSPVIRNQDRIEFRTEGVTNRPVIIQASTDLGGWQNILTNTAGAGRVVLPWSAADGLHSFRALTP